MESTQWLQLPARLAREREAKGLSQRELAGRMGMHASQLCAHERGRRPSARLEFLDEFAGAMDLSANKRLELRWAFAHDQVLLRASQLDMPQEALALLSLALQAQHELGKSEVEGVRRRLTSALSSQRTLRELSADATADQEGTAMT